MMKVPLSLPSFDGEEERLIKEVLKSRWISRGVMLKQFEEMFTELLGVKHAIAVSNGTAALHLAMLGLGVGQGDEVITTPFTFISSVNAALFVGAKPALVDIDEKTMNIDTSKISDVINDETKAILPVHIFGQPCDMDKIMKLSEENDIPVVEDAAEALGTEYKGEKVGTFGKISTFSFFANKPITTGEGGMIVTDDDEIYKICSSLKNLGKGEGHFGYDRLGYNYHINELSCAMGIAQLKKFATIFSKRQKLFDEYTKRLKKLNLILPYVDSQNKYSWFLYVVRVKDDVNRDEVIEFLKERGIETKPYFYPPVHLQSFYKERFGFKEGDFPVTEAVSKSTIALPFFADLSMEDLEFVVESLEAAINTSGD